MSFSLMPPLPFIETAHIFQSKFTIQVQVVDVALLEDESPTWILEHWSYRIYNFAIEKWFSLWKNQLQNPSFSVNEGDLAT